MRTALVAAAAGVLLGALCAYTLLAPILGGTP